MLCLPPYFNNTPSPIDDVHVHLAVGDPTKSHFLR